MPYKNHEDQKASWRKHYSKNKKYYYERNLKRRKELRKWLISLKTNKPCVRCNNIFNHKAMDWHHKDSTKKLFDIANAVNHLYSKEKILKEINKCELICSNCHRTET